MALVSRPRSQVHHRKRHAGHHRRSKRYNSTYWPYLPMLLIVGLGLLVNSSFSPGGVLGGRSDFSTASLLTSTNAERLKRHETGLTLDPRLAAAAQAKADDMVQNNYWAHNSPTGQTPWTFIAAAGYQYQSAGENLAYGFGSASGSVAGWMGSPEHRANILDANYQNVGFGVANSPNYIGNGPQTVVVAEYGQPAAVAPAAPGGAIPSSDVFGTELAARPVSRVQMLAGDQSQWSLFLVVAITGAAGAIFILRHGYRLQRLLNKGEAFVVHHPYMDIVIVFIITTGCVLTRVTGIIR